jgi:hypothetical protein
MLAETAYSVGLSGTGQNLKVDSPCQLQNVHFVSGDVGNDKSTAFVNDFVCFESAFDLALELDCRGVCWYAYDGDEANPGLADKWNKYSGWLPLDVADDASQWVYVKACDKDPCTKGTESYTQFVFVKSGSDEPGLSLIKVTYKEPHIGHLILRPTFSPAFSEKTFKYKLQLRQDEDFIIETVCDQQSTPCGIEWIDPQLGADNAKFSSCRDQATDPVCQQDVDCQPVNAEYENGDVKKFHLKGFSTPREGGIITVCGYGNDAYQSRTNYNIVIEVVKVYSMLLKDIQPEYADKGSDNFELYPLYEADRKQTQTGSFNGMVSDWEILLPNVAKEKRWAIDRPNRPLFTVTFVAEDNNATIKVCPSEETDCKSGVSSEGKVQFEVRMPDNEERHMDREAPQWERTLVIEVTAPDNPEHHQQYRIKIKQAVSSRAFLSNLTFSSMCNAKLGSMIEFKPNVYDYKCVWTWDEYPDGTNAVMTPFLDNSTDKCRDCDIITVDPRRLRGEDTLFMDFMDIRYRQDPYWWNYDFTNGKKWEHPFLLGETHVIPIWVVAADHETKREYRITFEYDCPYALSATFSRTISGFVASLALVMAIGSAGNVMALSKQIQFMILSTLVDDAPETYKQFAKAKTLRIFTGDFDSLFDIPPFSWIQLPTEDWIEETFEHNFVRVQDSMLTGEVVTAVTKVCAIRELYGETAKDQDSDDARKATGALICFDHIPWDALAGDVDEFAQAEKEGVKFSGLDKLYWETVGFLSDDSDASKERADDINDVIRDCEMYTRWKEENEGGRRLAIMLEEPLRRSSGGSRKSGAPGSAHGNITGRRLTEDLLDEFEDDDEDDSVFFWDQDTVQEVVDDADDVSKFIQASDAGSVKADTFPNFYAMCDAEQIERIMFGVHQYQKFNGLYDSLTGRAGTYLSITFGMIIGGGIYYLWYLSFLRGVQYRLQFLEPGNLIFFVLNVLYIPYAMKTGKLAFTGMVQQDPKDIEENGYLDPEIDFLIGKLYPDQYYIIWIACWVGLIGFPISFVTLFTWYIHSNTKKHKLIWHGDFGINCWCDPKCIAAKLPRIPWLKKKLPILPGLLNRYVRMCIPILTKSGEPLVAQKLNELEGHEAEPEDEGHSESEPEDKNEEPESPGESPGKSQGNAKAVEARLKHSMQRAKEAEQQRAEKERRWDSQKAKLQRLVTSLEGMHDKVSEGDYTTHAPWMPWEDSHDEDGNVSREPDPYVRNMGLYNLVMSWEMRKGHPDGFKLDSEETFAMQQFLDGLVKLEKRLLAYNILKIVPHDGCLKPSEPANIDSSKSTVSGDDDEDSGTPFWLPTPADYFDDDKNDPQGRHKDLVEFGVSGTDHISNSFGERLVYEEPGRYSGRPMAQRYGNLKWMKEPDSGWKEWDLVNKPTEPTSTVRYADKWQWLASEYWTAPWNVDDISELEWELKCCGRVLHKFNPSDAVGKKFYLKVRKFYLQIYQSMVPHHIPLEEKVEMRKWVYCKLMHCMDMKLKAIYFSVQHPDFATSELLALEQMAKSDFHDSLLAIYTAKPTSGNPHLKSDSLINYTIMKIEDTYEEEEEPWWEACDPLLDGEMKVQFDHPVFWQRGDALIKPRELLHHISVNDMVPANGYWSSEYIDKVLDASVGMKRYMLTKPDGSSTQVSIEVELEHVPSLMCYTHGFKVSMPFESLELPYRQFAEILICEMGPGEQYNFGVEGLTLVLSVIVLSSQDVLDSIFPETTVYNPLFAGCPDDPSPKEMLEECQVHLFSYGALICALSFFLAKATAFTFGMNRAMYGEKNEYEEDEDEAKTLVSVKSTQEIRGQESMTITGAAKPAEDEEVPEEATVGDHFFQSCSGGDPKA